MKEKIKEYIKSNNLFNKNDSVVLGVSGGADSICMLNLLNDLKSELSISLFVLHINHEIREEAENDALFVKKTADDLGVECKVVSINVPRLSKEKGISTEEAGRLARYEELLKYANEVGATKIAVAHNKNDDSETILLNLFRGTGIKGLCGIDSKREIKDSDVVIVRPLLCVSREEIEYFLDKNRINHIEDASNNDREYTRNKIRLDVIPYIKENINSKVDDNITNASENLVEIYEYVNKMIDESYERFVKDGLWLSDGFDLEKPIESGLVRKMIEEKAGKLKDISRIHIDEVTGLKEKQVGKRVSLPYNLVAERTYDGIVIREDMEVDTFFENPDEVVKISLEENFDKDNIEEFLYTKWLDYDKISELTVRHRQEGDYLVIDQSGGRKKLKDYLIDIKVPQAKRDDLWLVADGKHIVWVVGYRISEDVKVSQDTERVVKLEYVEKEKLK